MKSELKTKQCEVCEKEFIKRSMGQTVCGVRCAVRMILDGKKKEREAIRGRRQKLKTRSDWIKDAQRAFNSYIRSRDIQKPCICCGLPLGDRCVGGGFDCGHYRSVGSAPHLRFDERNAHGQRKQCNRYGAGRAVDYRIGLVARIGLEAVEALEADQSTAKWSVEQLKEIKAKYKRMLKELGG